MLEYKLEKTCFGDYDIIMKLPSMRKEKSFSVYPTNENEKYIMLQSETSCAVVNKTTGETIYSSKGSAPIQYYVTFKPTKKFTLDMDTTNLLIKLATKSNVMEIKL